MSGKKRKKRELTPFGKAVKKKLIDMGMTQGQLEKEIGAPFNYVTQMLYGEKLGLKYIPKIAEVLGIDISKWVS